MPQKVAIVRNVALPTSAHPITNMNVAGFCDSGAHGDCSNEFRDTCEDSSLPHLQCPGSHGRGIRIRNIVGAIRSRREKESDRSKG